MLEMYFHHQIWGIYETGVNLFIAPSRFMKQTCEEFGWPANKIIWLHNFFNESNNNDAIVNEQKSSNYLLYFGRLAEEKGISTLLQALTNTDSKLKIAGEGPEESSLKVLAATLGLEKRVEFLGFKTGTGLEELIKNAQAIVIPSVWYENMPLNMLEAMAKKKVVIASNIGGMPEIISDGQNGLLFEPGNPEALAAKIKSLAELNCEALGLSARETVKNLNADEHVQKILKIYEQVINKKTPA